MPRPEQSLTNRSRYGAAESFSLGPLRFSIGRMAVSPQRRRDIIDALRAGTVPRKGLDLLAVNMDRFESVIDDEVRAVREGGAILKAIRGEYGSGKTFFARWVQEQTKRAGFDVTEVRIIEAEHPL